MTPVGEIIPLEANVDLFPDTCYANEKSALDMGGLYTSIEKTRAFSLKIPS
jgi:hypothetical protein